MLKMILGLAYNPNDEQLVKDRIRIRKLFYKFNRTPPATVDETSSVEEERETLDATGFQRRQLQAKMFNLAEGQTERINIEPPFYW